MKKSPQPHADITSATAAAPGAGAPPRPRPAPDSAQAPACAPALRMPHPSRRKAQAARRAKPPSERFNPLNYARPKRRAPKRAPGTKAGRGAATAASNAPWDGLVAPAPDRPQPALGRPAASPAASTGPRSLRPGGAQPHTTRERDPDARLADIYDADLYDADLCDVEPCDVEPCDVELSDLDLRHARAGEPRESDLRARGPGWGDLGDRSHGGYPGAHYPGDNRPGANCTGGSDPGAGPLDDAPPRDHDRPSGSPHPAARRRPPGVGRDNHVPANGAATGRAPAGASGATAALPPPRPTPTINPPPMRPLVLARPMVRAGGEDYRQFPSRLTPARFEAYWAAQASASDHVDEQPPGQTAAASPKADPPA